MPTVGDSKTNPLKLLLFGPPGSGKTLLALTLGENAMIFDLDRGVESAMGAKRRNLDKFVDDRLKVDHVEIVESDPVNQATVYERVKQYLIAVNNAIFQDLADKTPGKRYNKKHLIIDSFTTLADSALRYVLRNNGRLHRPLTVEKGNVTQPEWGLMINEIEMIVQIIRGLPINVILIAHSVPVKNDNGSIVKYEVSIPTQRLPPRIPAYFDEQWFIEPQPGPGGVTKRVLRTDTSPMFEAKSRAGLKDGTEVNVGMKEIFRQLGREV